MALIDETGTWSVAVCGRQAGKNFTVVRLMLLTALTVPNAEVIYVNATFAEARRIMWADELDGVPAVARDLGLLGAGVRPNETRLELSFPNGSKITLLGADRGAWDKLRGSKLNLLVVDEMQKAEDEGMRKALDLVVPACLVSRRGRFVGIGTPDEFCAGLLHDICVNGSHPQFRSHHWDASDNTKNQVPWEGLLRWKEEAGLADDDPRWLREGKGLWVAEEDKLMLPLYTQSLWDGQYPALIPSISGVPVPRRLSMEFYAGLDFGFTDSAALVVGSISREEGILREVESWKSPGLDTEQLADVVRAFVSKYGIRRIYGDSADPKTILDMSRKFRLPVVAVEKHNKVTWIRDMQSRARTGRFLVLRDSQLHTELRTLRPDPMQLRRKRLESPPGAEDHCWDAGRYLYRGVFSEWIRSPDAPMTEDERQMSEAARRKEEALSRGSKPKVTRRTIG